MHRQTFAFRFLGLFIFALLATFKIWISTQAMSLQTRLDKAQATFEHLHVESNRLLLNKTQLINRDRLQQRALELGYQEPREVLYVLQP